MADLDPDYEHEDVEEHQAKRQRVIEQDAKTASIKRIEGIVRTQFKVEIENKEAEVNVVDQTQSGHIWDWGKYDRQPNQFQRRQEHRGSRFTIKKKIVVGNVSKFIPAGQREMNDQSSHKWMVYVRLEIAEE
nr:hypothetical protein BaRGS_009809 [Batillaria attramentaria]